MVVIVIVVVVEKSIRDGDENSVVKMVEVTMVLSLKLSPDDRRNGYRNGRWRHRWRGGGHP